MPSDRKHSTDRSNWYSKARSRAFVKSRPSLRAIPRLPLLLATFFYCGLSPIASGTVGSAVAALLYWFIVPIQSPEALSICVLLVLIIGTLSSAIVEREMKVQDPGIVVIDEVLGQWIALISLSYAGHPLYIILAFLAFRFFDIVKLWPARYFERMHGGIGIMLDDAVAGIYANIAAHLAMFAILSLID